MSSLGNSANGLLSKTPNANSSGVTPSDTLKDLATNKNAATTASQKVGSVMNGIGNKVGEFFTPPKDSGGLNLTKNVPTSPNASSSMSGEMRSGASQMSQSNSQAQRQATSTPRSTSNGNLNNSRKSAQGGTNSHKPYEPRNSEQTNSTANSSTGSPTMSNLQNTQSANVGNAVQNGRMRQNTSNASSASVTENVSASPSSSSGEMAEFRSATTASSGNISTSGAMRQNLNTTTETSINNSTTKNSAGERNAAQATSNPKR